MCHPFGTDGETRTPGEVTLCALRGQMVWFGRQLSEVRPCHTPCHPCGPHMLLHRSEPQLLTHTRRQSQDLPHQDIKQLKPLERAWQAVRTPGAMALGAGGRGGRESVRNPRPRSQPGLEGPGITCPVPSMPESPTHEPPSGPSVSLGRSFWLISHEPDLSRARQHGGWETWK